MATAPDTDVRGRRETRENRGRGRGRGGRKYFKTGHDADKTNLIHNVPFLKHGGSINACMLWNLRVADYADTEDLDIGQEIRMGEIADDQEKMDDYVAQLQEKMMPIVEDSDAQRLRPRQQAKIDSMRMEMAALPTRAEKIAMKARIAAKTARFEAKNLDRIKVSNNTARLTNKALEKKIEKEAIRILELPQKRTKITLFMFSRMSTDMQAHVRQHKLWDEELGMQNHPHVVKAITMDIANGQSDDEWRKRHLARKNFESFKQRGEYSRWIDFSQEWKNRLQLATNAGLDYDQNDLINFLMQAIDPSKFESIISDYDRGAEHWQAVVGNYDNVYQLISYLGQLDMRRQERNADQMRRQAQGQTAFSVSESDRSGGRHTQDSGRSNPRRGGRGGRRPPSNSGGRGGRGTPKCFLCQSGEHLISDCPMKAEFEAFRSRSGSTSNRAASGGGLGSASAVNTMLHALPAAVGDPQVLDYSHYDSPCYNDLCERSGCFGVCGASAATTEVDLIFDSATDISVIGDERLALDLEPINASLRGFNGASSQATAIATLPGRLGKALLVPGAQNLLGSKDLADMGWQEQYRIADSNGSWELIHEDGDVLHFEAVDYDRKPHLKLSLQEYFALSVNQFLQPEPPREMDFASLSDKQLRELDMAKDLHASLNHPSKAALLSAIKAANGSLRATAEGAELFHRFVKCPACLEGKMRSQDHIPSEAQRLDYPIGYASETDILKWCGTLYLITVCVSSKMYFLTPIPGRALEHLKSAFDDVLATYRLHGHTLKQVSCDRESAVSVMGVYLSSLGVSLNLKASSQKCPRAEVAIRSIKDTARATCYGIQNDFGYLLPAGRLRQLLLLDAVKVLNRRVRRNETRSPFELFTGKSIDYSRDFRAPFGTVVVAHRPRRGSSRDTVDIRPKAEIGLSS